MADGGGEIMHSVTPGPETARAFRDALGRFATGVTVVTCQSEIGPLGITANSFASVSIDPPLILWSPARASRRFPAFAAAEHFAIHVLGEEQEALCRRFSREGTDFDGLDWHEGAARTPLIAGCLARYECETVARHEGGDHLIVVAKVTRADWRPGAPLVFSGGGYGRFTKPG
jgi:flavin reductase (DIM6/NTAB) family NADH-FMN oxidoreductase RutF